MYSSDDATRLRPVPHKLVNNGNGDSCRGWYVRMFFPPKSVVDYDEITKSNNGFGCTTMVAAGLANFERMLDVESCEDDDGNAGIMCWKQCVSTASTTCDDGESVI